MQSALEEHGDASPSDQPVSNGVSQESVAQVIDAVAEPAKADGQPADELTEATEAETPASAAEDDASPLTEEQQSPNDEQASVATATAESEDDEPQKIPPEETEPASEAALPVIGSPYFPSAGEPIAKAHDQELKERLTSLLTQARQQTPETLAPDSEQAVEPMVIAQEPALNGSAGYQTAGGVVETTTTDFYEGAFTIYVSPIFSIGERHETWNSLATIVGSASLISAEMDDDNYSMVVKVDVSGRKVFLPQFAKQFSERHAEDSG